MRWFRTTVCGLLLTLAPAAALAEPFNPREVPATSRWVLHLDMDTARAGKLWDMIYQQAVQHRETQVAARIKAFENLTGMKFPQDLHDVTLFGQQFTENAGVVMIHATLDQAKVVTLARANPDYASAKYGSYEIHSWKDKGKTLYGAFHGASRLLISQSRPAVEAALDTLDAKAKSLPADSPLATAAKTPSTLLYLAGQDLADLATAQSPLLRQMDAAWMTIAEQGENVVLRSSVQARTPETADHMRTCLEGVKSTVVLAAGDGTEEHAKATAALLQNLVIKVQDRTVTTEWPVSLDTVRNALAHLPAHARRATTATKPATASGNIMRDQGK